MRVVPDRTQPPRRPRHKGFRTLDHTWFHTAVHTCIHTGVRFWFRIAFRTWFHIAAHRFLCHPHNCCHDLHHHCWSLLVRGGFPYHKPHFRNLACRRWKLEGGIMKYFFRVGRHGIHCPSISTNQYQHQQSAKTSISTSINQHQKADISINQN